MRLRFLADSTRREYSKILWYLLVPVGLVAFVDMPGILQAIVHEFKYIYFPPARDVVELKDGQDLEAANRDMARRALARYVSKHRARAGDGEGKRDSERAE